MLKLRNGTEKRRIKDIQWLNLIWALCIAMGEGVKQNRTVAKEWLGKACNNGDKKGCLYYKKLK